MRWLGLAALALLAGCGGGADAGEVLERTAANMERIRSADVSLRLVLEPERDPASGRVGFALRGPVDLEAGALPAARLAYTQIAGPREGGGTFVSTGEEAFVEVAGSAYALPPEQASALEGRAGAVRGGARLPVGRWLRDPAVEDGGTVGGAETDRVTAELDAVAALRDIFGAASGAGLEVPDLEGAAADELRDAVSSATAELWSGREDRLLRRLRLRIAFEVEPPRALRDELGDLAGGRLAFDADLAKVNEPVRVEAPADARPLAELSGSPGG